MERAARLSGARFGYLIGDTALLALAVYRYALDVVRRSTGFLPVLPPVLVREEAMYGTGFFPTDRSNIYADRERRPLPDRHVGGRARRPAHGRDPRRAAAPLRRVTRRTSAARRAPPARTRAGCSACTSSTRSRCSRSCEPSRVGRRARAAARDRGADPPGARDPVPRRQRRRRRPRRAGREEVRLRGLVPVPGALPRADVDVEHDRLPGAAARHPLPRRQEPRAGAHAERHRGRPIARCSRSSRTSRATCPTCCARTARPVPSHADGGVPERSNGTALKVVEPFGARGFESHPRR